MRLIRNFMIVFGLHSSFFDFLVFYALYFYYHLPVSAFQTGWFMESVFTELFILFIMRTRKPFLSSRPGKWLLILGAVCFAATVWLPQSPFAAELGLTGLQSFHALFIAAVIVCYVVTADILKIIFFKFNSSAGR